MLRCLSPVKRQGTPNPCKPLPQAPTTNTDLVTLYTAVFQPVRHISVLVRGRFPSRSLKPFSPLSILPALKHTQQQQQQHCTSFRSDKWHMAMASLNGDPAGEIAQEDGAIIPRIGNLAEEIAGTLPPAIWPAKRKRDKMDIQVNLPNPLPIATAKDNDDNSQSLKNWKPSDGIITRIDLEEIYSRLGSNTPLLNQLRGHKVREENERSESCNPEPSNLTLIKVAYDFALRKTQSSIDRSYDYQLEAAYIQLRSEPARPPCEKCLAGEGPFELCVRGPAKTGRCGNCHHRNPRARCLFLKAGKENDDLSSRNPQNSQAALRRGATSTSGKGNEGTNGENKSAAPTVEVVSKPSQHADVTESPSDLQFEARMEVEPEQTSRHPLPQTTPQPPAPPPPPFAPVANPEPEPVHPVGGRQLRKRPPRLPPNDQRPRQTRQNWNTTATDPVLAGSNQQPQARHGSSATNTNPPANPPNPPSLTPGIDTPLSPRSETSTPAVQSPRLVGGYQPQFPAAVVSAVSAQIFRGQRDHTAPRNRDTAQTRATDMNTNRERERNSDRDRERNGERERDREKDVNREKDRDRDTDRERTPITSSDRSSPPSSPDACSPKSILDCLHRNTPVEVLRCLMEYHQNQADEMVLECEKIEKSRARRVLWHPGREEEGRDNKGRNRDRDKGGFGSGAGAIGGDTDDCSTIRACIGPGQTPLETMQHISLHYQYQANKLRLEMKRIELDEKEMRRQRQRERQRQRGRGGAGWGGRENDAR